MKKLIFCFSLLLMMTPLFSGNLYAQVDEDDKQEKVIPQEYNTPAAYDAPAPARPQRESLRAERMKLKKEMEAEREKAIKARLSEKGEKDTVKEDSTAIKKELEEAAEEEDGTFDYF